MGDCTNIPLLSYSLCDVGVADVVKAPVHHVDTAVVGVRVPSPAEEKTHIG